MRLLHGDSLNEVIVLAAASRRAAELREEELRTLARMIREEIVQAWNKGRR